ncbi:Uma2 family endonuclease [Pontibacter sp. G13]|uniref:Uma2 family endonuclease n=1 Tax=Pontibacter sp. G13 TaxID=3074898 RepID=UPI00288A39AF|nr:Uma2 family endonuclease [Pontibacter sp. G13]WNJ21305.1 Uma2 family endonuclease [Pontibacter sp. G13]
MNPIITSKILGQLPDDAFAQFCAEQRDLRIERNSDGTVIIMAPTFSESGRINMAIGAAVYFWNQQSKAGVVFDSSAGFSLPNGALRSPDVSWVSQDRLDALENRTGYLPLCPDFVMELRSESDRLPLLQEKMAEYLSQGAKLGWLIDPVENQVFIYSAENGTSQQIGWETPLSGDPVLPGFTIDMSDIIQP